MNAVVQTQQAKVETPTLRLGASQVSLMLATAVLVVGWLLPLSDYITPRSGLGYALGIIGGSMMLALLIYPLRKRVPSLTWLGSARGWFTFHMVLGVVGPLCILYHANYHLGATNSNVALISMLIVAGSGLIGRYLYARIHYGLNGRMANLAELRTEAERLKADSSGAARLLPELPSRLDAAEQRISKGALLLPRPIAALVLCHWNMYRLRSYVHQTLHRAAKASPTVATHRSKLVAAADRYTGSRLSAARRVAEFESCVQLFGLWHLLHLPLFGMLFVAGIVHVVAVNVY
jgi:hypothetical protein